MAFDACLSHTGSYHVTTRGFITRTFISNTKITRVWRCFSQTIGLNPKSVCPRLKSAFGILGIIMITSGNPPNFCFIIADREKDISIPVWNCSLFLGRHLFWETPVLRKTLLSVQLDTALPAFSPELSGYLGHTSDLRQAGWVHLVYFCLSLTDRLLVVVTSDTSLLHFPRLLVFRTSTTSVLASFACITFAETPGAEWDIIIPFSVANRWPD